MTAPRPAQAGDAPVAVPHRITMALDLRSLYGPDVDEACGVAEPAVDRWESGDERPTPDQLQRLADLTGFPVAFFFAPVDEPAVGPITVCTRSGKGRGCQVVTPPPPVCAPKPGASFSPERLLP